MRLNKGYKYFDKPKKKPNCMEEHYRKSQCSWDCPKISDRGQGQMAEYVKGAKQQFAEQRRETQKTGRGHHLLHSLRQWQTLLMAAAPLWGSLKVWRHPYQSKQVCYFTTQILWWTLISTITPLPSESCLSLQLANIPITFILSAWKHIMID